MRFEVEEMWAERVYDEPRGKVDLSRERCTNIKTNDRIIMPNPMTAKEETRISVRTDKTMEISRKYVEKHCNEEGRPMQGGFTKEMERGIQKLQERVKQGEIVIRTTDKSKRLCISTYESYVRQGNVHAGTDREVDEEEIRSIQKKINTTTARNCAKS